jgi:hypothetical protein
MCDYSAKLIAWLDHELDADLMAEVQRHLRDCIECRTQLAKFELVSKSFDSCCDAVLAAKVRKRPRWVPVLSAAAAVALAVTLALGFLRPRVQPLAPAPLVVATRPVVFPEPTPPPSKAVRRKRMDSRAPVQTANWLPAEPTIQVTIPPESMFPPGAVPEGVNFIADVSFGPDGSAQQICLRPRLIGFERRTIQP